MGSSVLLGCYIIMILLIVIMCLCIYQIVTSIKRYKKDLKEAEVHSYIKLYNLVKNKEKDINKTI